MSVMLLSVWAPVWAKIFGLRIDHTMTEREFWWQESREPTREPTPIIRANCFQKYGLFIKISLYNLIITKQAKVSRRGVRRRNDGWRVHEEQFTINRNIPFFFSISAQSRKVWLLKCSAKLVALDFCRLCRLASSDWALNQEPDYDHGGWNDPWVTSALYLRAPSLDSWTGTYLGDFFLNEGNYFLQ